MTTWKFDLHNHVNGDPQDNIVHSAEDLIQKAAEEDYSAIALTPHLHQLSWDSAQEKAQDLGILLIEGVEITLQGRHILVLGMDPKDTEDIQNPAELHRLLRTPRPRTDRRHRAKRTLRKPALFDSSC